MQVRRGSATIFAIAICALIILRVLAPVSQAAELRLYYRVQGYVRDSSGAYVRNADINIYNITGAGSPNNPIARTDNRGYYIVNVGLKPLDPEGADVGDKVTLTAVSSDLQGSIIIYIPAEGAGEWKNITIEAPSNGGGAPMDILPYAILGVAIAVASVAGVLYYALKRKSGSGDARERGRRRK